MNSPSSPSLPRSHYHRHHYHHCQAKAPIRRFLALKELINSCDKLMAELKPRVKRLSGVYERSDAMLAIYPGGRLYVLLCYSLSMNDTSCIIYTLCI